MLGSYVLRELLRNPRRTISSLAGILLGIGLFSSVLFFVDGSGASMTKRALAPLAIDMQRVLTAPLGGGLELRERLSRSGSLPSGGTVRVTMTVANRSTSPANEVVVRDQAPSPLVYVGHTTMLNGRLLPDPGGSSPLAQGLARTGLNIGTVPPGTAVRISYDARAAQPILSLRALHLQATISTREDVVPAPANVPSRLTQEQLRRRIAALPGVAAADSLSFVDLEPGSLGTGTRTVRDTVRVFGFDRGYQRRYPSIQVVAGSFRPGAALVSVEAARALGIHLGERVRLRLPGRSRPLTLQVSGLADLSRAKPLFYSRESSQLEAFLYVPNSVVLDPATFQRTVIPAFRTASSARGAGLKTQPLLEVDVQVRRSRLHSDPGTALAQTQHIAGSIRRIAPRQDYLIDNISNTLQVARDDAAVAKRMFLFLGLPGVLLAALLAAYAGGVLAAAQRREQAILRIRGAHVGHLLLMLAYRTLALAGVGSVLGAGLGFISTLAVLGSGSLLKTAPSALVVSGLVSVGVGWLVTGLALYLSGRRSLRREIGQERGELAPDIAPAWRRLRLDLVLVLAAAIGETVAFRTGAFDALPGSVYLGRAVSLPSYLLLAPLAAWLGGMLLGVRLFQFLAARLALPGAGGFGPLVRGILVRTLRRRSWALGGGMLAVGLVSAFGTSLAFFASTYNTAKAADARFAVGSDLRVTPSVGSTRSHPPGYASRLVVPGVVAATPVVFSLENAVLFSTFNQDRMNLAAIDPASFTRVATLPDSFFTDTTAAAAMSALRRDPHSVLVDATTADNFKIQRGARVDVLFARGTRYQTRVGVRVVGLFERFPGFPQGVNVVANVSEYVAATRRRHADFFLARTADQSTAGLDRAETALRAGPGRGDPLVIDTTRTTFDKDQSSLTALNVHGLVTLDSLYTLLLAATAIAIFVFGLMLQRRREYVTLRAQGMHTRELQALVLGESVFVAVGGLLAGVAVGTGMAYMLIHVLRPLFVLRPAVVLPTADLATIAGLALAAALVSGVAATAMLRLLRPTELLREE